MAFKPVGKITEHEYTCACGETFRSYLSPEKFAELGWVKNCLHCQLSGR